MKPSRILLITIIATGVFYVGSFTALGSGFPTIDSSGEEIVSWFADHATNARIYAWTGAFVSLGLAIWGGQIASVLPKPHRYIFFAGLLGGAITVQVQAWFWAGLAFRPEGLDPVTAHTIFAIPAYWGPFFNGSTMTMAIAFLVLGFGEAPLIPRWLAWLSVVFFLEQGIETITVFGTSGFIAPGGTMNVYLGGVIGFAWVGGVTNWGMHRLDAASAPTR